MEGTALTYKIDTFEGPLDLLLTLISKNKMDIKDIQISLIFSQYMEYLEEMRRMDMEIAGEFIVMASELMLIKSKMLLPRVEEEEEDPRARLAAALLEYQRAKEAAKYLEEQYAIYSRRFAKDTDEVKADKNEVADQDIALLQAALVRLFSKKDREAPPPMTNIKPIISKVVVPVSHKIRSVSVKLRREGCVRFESLFDEAESKSEIVAIFIAVLALIKDGHVILEKRLEKPETDTASDGELADYDYTFYCSLDPAHELSDEEISAYDET